jgi:hypothetical protein
VFRPSHDVPGTIYADTKRRSVVIVVATESFVRAPFDERLGSGQVRELRIVPYEPVGMLTDRIVTCVMVAWALTIFVGMSCLAALI